MRLVVNDYAGHPFQYQLSGQLASMGYDVDHAYCCTNLTPHADFDQPGEGLSVHPISVGRTFNKYRPLRRAFDELVYGIKSARLIGRQTDVVMASNVPLLSLAVLWSWAWVLRVRRVLWLQDFQAGLARKVIGSPRWSWALSLFSALERWLVRRSDHVVAISPGFEEEIRRLGQDHCTMIRNWAPLRAPSADSGPNRWADRHDLLDATVFMYTGTLGTKHRPDLLLALAERFRSADDVKVVVVSEGPAAEELKGSAQAAGLKNMVFLPFQEHSDLPDVLASADVLVALLDQDAAALSVPSKVLSYLSAGRPILASIPAANDAANVVAQSGSGLVAFSDEQFLQYGAQLRDDVELRARFGAAGAAYAATAFDVESITPRFVAVLDEARRLGPVTS